MQTGGLPAAFLDPVNPFTNYAPRGTPQHPDSLLLLASGARDAGAALRAFAAANADALLEAERIAAARSTGADACAAPCPLPAPRLTLFCDNGSCELVPTGAFNGLGVAVADAAGSGLAEPAPFVTAPCDTRGWPT